MQIAKKLKLHIFIVAVTSVVAAGLLIGVFLYFNTQDSLVEVTKDRFTSYRNLKADQVREYFRTKREQLSIFASNMLVNDAAEEIISAFNSYAAQENKLEHARYKPTVVKHYLEDFTQTYSKLNGGESMDARKLLNTLDETSFDLQYHYVINNPYVSENKKKLDYVSDGSKYSQVHKIYHPKLRRLQEKLEVHDIFIVDSVTGNVVYNVSKELDFTTSLFHGPYADSGLGRVFNRANSATTADYTTIEDFSPHLPSYNKQAAFMAAPIFNDANKKVAVLIFQLSINAIGNIMTNNGSWEEIGLGKTGESYIIGADYKMRSVSRFFAEDPEGYLAQLQEDGVEAGIIEQIKAKNTNIGLQEIQSDGAKAVIEGKQGTIDYLDYRGVRALSSFEPLNIPGLNWGIICGIDADEALHSAVELAKKVAMNVLLVIALVSVAGLFLGVRLSRQISWPIERLSRETREIAKSQDLTRRISVGEDNEIGSIANAINALIASFQFTFQKTMESTEQMQTAAHRLRRLSMDNLKEKTVVDTNDLLRESSQDIEDLSTKLQGLSNQFKFLEDEAERTSGW